VKLAVGAIGATPSWSSSSSERAFEYCSCSIMLYSSFVSTCTPSQIMMMMMMIVVMMVIMFSDDDNDDDRQYMRCDVL